MFSKLKIKIISKKAVKPASKINFFVKTGNLKVFCKSFLKNKIISKIIKKNKKFLKFENSWKKLKK